MEQLDRYKGCLLGLAVGDAVGTTVEFKPRGSFEPVTNMVGGGPFNLEVGQWTDDTSMALCLGQSLIDCGGFNAKDQMSKYCEWHKNGYMSSNGICFDIGNTTSNALNKFHQSSNPYCGLESPWASGNGGIMRLSPVPMVYADNVKELIQFCSASSRTTHASNECIESAQLFGIMVRDALAGYPKHAIFENDNSARFNEPKVIDISNNGFIDKTINEIKGSGYVIESLEASLWCFYHTDNFKDAILTAVNLGDDADTTAAITGQIAGAYYGVDGIPKEWLDKLCQKDMIEDMSFKLFELSKNIEV